MGPAVDIAADYAWVLPLPAPINSHPESLDHKSLQSAVRRSQNKQQQFLSSNYTEFISVQSP